MATERLVAIRAGFIIFVACLCSEGCVMVVPFGIGGSSVTPRLPPASW
jgi:hypothetical protein